MIQRMLSYKTCLDTKTVLYQDRFSSLSKLQNWICPKTVQYKACMISNTKTEASIRATEPKPWQSLLTSETVEIFIQNEKAGLVPMQSRFWCSRFMVGAKPLLVQQVKDRNKASFGAAGLGTAQGRVGMAGLASIGTKPVLLQQV